MNKEDLKNSFTLGNTWEKKFLVVVISEGKFKHFGLSNYSAWEVVSVAIFGSL